MAEPATWRDYHVHVSSSPSGLWWMELHDPDCRRASCVMKDRHLERTAKLEDLIAAAIYDSRPKGGGSGD